MLVSKDEILQIFRKLVNKCKDIEKEDDDNNDDELKVIIKCITLFLKNEILLLSFSYFCGIKSIYYTLLYYNSLSEDQQHLILSYLHKVNLDEKEYQKLFNITKSNQIIDMIKCKSFLYYYSIALIISKSYNIYSLFKIFLFHYSF